MANPDMSRFNTRPTKEQKEIFEKHNLILASHIDQETFFEAILNPGKPNKELKEVLDAYNQVLKG